jgi:hypothetical protein
MMEDIILGTILGGSSIVCPNRGKNCYLSMRSRNLDWLRWKATELRPLASENPMTAEKTYRWHSMCYPIFTQMRSRFYGEGRELKLEAFEQIRDTSYTVWFGDCGKISRGCVILNTHIWKEEGSHIIKEYFGLIDYNAEVIKERKYFRVKLDSDSSQDFLTLACKKMPNFMMKNIPSYLSDS